jgi:hypothetical protein
MAQKRVVPTVALRRLRDAALVWRQAAVAAVEGVKTRHDRRLDGLVPATADGTTDSVVNGWCGATPIGGPTPSDGSASSIGPNSAAVGRRHEHRWWGGNQSTALVLMMSCNPRHRSVVEAACAQLIRWAFRQEDPTGGAPSTTAYRSRSPAKARRNQAMERPVTVEVRQKLVEEIDCEVEAPSSSFLPEFRRPPSSVMKCFR